MKHSSPSRIDEALKVLRHDAQQRIGERKGETVGEHAGNSIFRNEFSPTLNAVRTTRNEFYSHLRDSSFNEKASCKSKTDLSVSIPRIKRLLIVKEKKKLTYECKV